MLRQVLKSKIHRAFVTDANLNYIGSITVDKALLEKANLIEFEKVQVVNFNNGERFETYVIAGEETSGVICLNGGAARLAQTGDIVTILAYTWTDAEPAPRIVHVDGNNKTRMV
jgi:L-aspartate-alpha-decarboxylase